MQEQTGAGGRSASGLGQAISTLNQVVGLAMAQFYLVVVFVTVWEIAARYIFNAPTPWAFEVVITFCATAWMLSAGYVTLMRRHISISVVYDMTSKGTQSWLDRAALVIGIVALTLFIDDNMMRALSSLSGMEKTGAGFNSPQPAFVKSALTVGSILYLSQLLVQLHTRMTLRIWRIVVSGVAILIALRIFSNAAEHFGLIPDLFGMIQQAYASVGEWFNPKNYVNARSYDLGLVTIVMVGSLLILMMTGLPLGIVTLTVSIVSSLVFFGPSGIYLVSSNAFGLAEQYSLIAVPLFVLMATILERAGIAKDLFDAMAIFAGNLRGGVAVQTTVVAVILAAMSGVMGGEIVMLGLVALPQMLRLGYDPRLATGVICAAGSLATLIPPSIVMIVYGLSANVGIGDLFLAGFLPGLLLATLYACYVLVRCAMNPALAPTAGEIAEAQGERIALDPGQKLAVFLCILLVFGVMGSIYGGIATVTEAAGVGVMGAILVAAVRFQFNWRMLQSSLVSTMSNVGHHLLAGGWRCGFRGNLQSDWWRPIYARAVPWAGRRADCSHPDHDGGPGGLGHVYGVDRDHVPNGPGLRSGDPGSRAGAWNDTDRSFDMVRSSVCDERAGLFPVAPFWPGLFLAEIGRAERGVATSNFPGSAAVHRAADPRDRDGYVFPADRARPAKPVVNLRVVQERIPYWFCCHAFRRAKESLSLLCTGFNTFGSQTMESGFGLVESLSSPQRITRRLPSEIIDYSMLPHARKWRGGKNETCTVSDSRCASFGWSRDKRCRACSS